MAIDLTGVNTYHPTITVPEAGDDRVAASIVPAFQKLLDNTTNLDARADALDSADHTWTGENKFDAGSDVVLGENVEVSYEAPILRKVMVPLRPLWTLGGYDAAQWLFSESNLQWAGATNTVRFCVVFGADLVPTGARIKKVRAAINSSVGVRLEFSKFTYPTDGSADAGTEGTDMTDEIAAGALAVHMLEVTCDELVHNDHELFKVSVRLLDDPPSFALRWIQIEFTDPGPRNF